MFLVRRFSLFEAVVTLIECVIATVEARCSNLMIQEA
jgi:hypothetical protein